MSPARAAAHGRPRAAARASPRPRRRTHPSGSGVRRRRSPVSHSCVLLGGGRAWRGARARWRAAGRSGYVPPLGPQGTCHRWCRHRWHRHHRHQRRQALMACGDKRKLRRQAQVPSLAASSRWSRASLDLRLSRWSRASLAASSRWRPRVRRRAATLWHSRRRAQGRLSQQRAPSACLAFAYAFASASTRGQALRGSRGTACQRRGR